VPSADSMPGAGPVFPAVNYGETGGPGSADPKTVYQQGFEAGQAAARQQGSAEIEAMHSQLARTIEELTGLRPRFRHEAEQDLVALALAIARRILHRELTVDPDALLGLVKAGLEKIELREVHRVRVSRADAARVRQYLEQIGSPQRIEVIADAGLGPGAAILDSSRGTLDASIETQLAEIERGFADLVRSAP
jgi:flagellar assembly protein FliH